jgi:hypothetical protein
MTLIFSILTMIHNLSKIKLSSYASIVVLFFWNNLLSLIPYELHVYFSSSTFVVGSNSSNKSHVEHI